MEHELRVPDELPVRLCRRTMSIGDFIQGVALVVCTVSLIVCGAYLVHLVWWEYIRVDKR